MSSQHIDRASHAKADPSWAVTLVENLLFDGSERGKKNVHTAGTDFIGDPLRNMIGARVVGVPVIPPGPIAHTGDLHAEFLGATLRRALRDAGSRPEKKHAQTRAATFQHTLRDFDAQGSRRVNTKALGRPYNAHAVRRDQIGIFNAALHLEIRLRLDNDFGIQCDDCALRGLVPSPTIDHIQRLLEIDEVKGQVQELYSRRLIHESRLWQIIKNRWPHGNICVSKALHSFLTAFLTHIHKLFKATHQFMWPQFTSVSRDQGFWTRDRFQVLFTRRIAARRLIMSSRFARSTSWVTISIGLAFAFGACSSNTPNPASSARDTPRNALSLQDPTLRENEDPDNQVFGALLEKGRVVKFEQVELKKENFGSARPEKKRTDEKIEPGPRSKLHPELERMLQNPDAHPETVPLIVQFRDDTVIPRFPEPATDEPRDSAINQRALKRADEIVNSIEQKRAGEYRELSAVLEQQYKAKTVNTFWLVKAMVVQMPLDAVKALAERDEVLTLEPQFSGEKPPVNDVVNSRALMDTDPYFNLGLTGGWIGLLDTGVRRTHTLFNSPLRLAIREDLTGGSNPNDDCWDHGTSSAGILSGNNNQGNAFRGVTAIKVDSFKVYPAGCGGLNGSAAIQGFQRAVQVLDRVIVAEMQGGGDDLSSISTAADNAFDAGAVIIAANGNNGPNAETVNSPANAHRVLGVGAIDVQTQAQQNYQSRGPTVDRRFKPDIQAPTNVETASSASDTARQVFGGTSAATPHAAGAAALLRNWLRGTSASIDPGQVYVQMILSGQQAYPFNNTSGAGKLKLPTNGWAWWGRTTISNHQTIDIPLNISSGSANTLDGALWWPESAAKFLGIRIEGHNDIDLKLIDPSGTVRDSSVSIPSVFERARVNGGVSNGQWKLRIYGYNVSGTQTVYWSAHIRN